MKDETTCSTIHPSSFILHPWCFAFCAIVGVASTSPLLGQPPGHPVMSAGQDRALHLHCRLEAKEDPVDLDVALALSSPAVESRLDQVVELPSPLPAIRVTRYLPRAERKQRFVADDGKEARCGIELSIDGPARSYQQWLIADDDERNRLISLIGTWRYMAVADKREREELFAQFKSELNRTPTLLIERNDGDQTRKLPAKAGVVRTFDDPGCTVLVKDFYPDFGIDTTTGKPHNQSDEYRNPAALLKLTFGGQTVERWVFARFPGFSRDKSQPSRFRITLDCPFERDSRLPDFALVTVGRSSHELWRHTGAKSTTRPIAIGERIEVPSSRHTFHIARFVPSGRLIEEFTPTERSSGVAALQIETKDPAGHPIIIWRERGRSSVIPTVRGPLTVVFGPR